MAQLYFRHGLHERPARFDHFFRSYPNYGDHQAGYCVVAGLEWLVDWMQRARFNALDVDYLRGHRGRTGERLFHDDFLDWLTGQNLLDAITLHAIPEGRVTHPNVPLTSVSGGLAIAQILETPLLNQLNYQTLVASKAARIHQAGRGQLMMEFGARRAQGGAAAAGARAALIGGAAASSNTGISYVLGQQPAGTHAHSMVQIFLALGHTELDAFRAYADSYPDDCLLLVDTIDTLQSGVPNAIRVFEELRRKGHKPVGIRLDSGDLAYLSIQAAQMLDEAGFPQTSIVLSNQIDELVLLQIITQIQDEAAAYGVDPDALVRRLVFGVGTRLITSAGDGALDGVYKLVDMQDESGQWNPAIKVSDSAQKIPNPGDKRAWRLYDRRDRAIADLLSLAGEDPRQGNSLLLRHPNDAHKFRELAREDIAQVEPLHVEVIRDGRIVYDFPTLDAIRQRRQQDIERLDTGVRRIMNPHIYHVSLTEKLWTLKQELVQSARQGLD